MFGKNFSLSYILAILVFVVCTLCFAACSGDPEDASLSSTGSSVSGASSVFAPPDVTELTVNIWADGNLAAGGEQWFRFAAVANTQYIHFSPGVLEGIFLQTYSDSGAAVDDPAFLSGDIPSVTRELSVARIYFIRVWVTTPAANGAYHIAYTAASSPPDVSIPASSADSSASGDSGTSDSSASGDSGTSDSSASGDSGTSDGSASGDSGTSDSSASGDSGISGGSASATSSAAPSGSTSIFISEITVGASNNKYIELYNPNEAAFNLDGWALAVQVTSADAKPAAGNTSEGSYLYEFADSVTIPARGTYVLANNLAQAGALAAAAASGVVITYANTTAGGRVAAFTANQRVVLYNGDTVVDRVPALTGQLGSSTYVRKSTVSVPNAAYDATEWTITSPSDADAGKHTWDPNAPQTSSGGSSSASFVSSVSGGVSSANSAGSAPANPVFISEIGLGASNNKYIELYNPTGATVVLTGWKLWSLAANASAEPSDVRYKLDLDAYTIPAYGTWVIANPQVTDNATTDTTVQPIVNAVAANGITIVYGASTPGASIASFTFSSIIALVYNGTVIDSWGTVGGTSGISANSVYVRKSDKSAVQPFNLADWNNAGANTYTDAGRHTWDNAPPTSSGGSSSAGFVSSVAGDGVFTENMALTQTVRDYYRSAYGLSGPALKTKLQQIISAGHINIGYNWTFQNFDSVTAGASQDDAGLGKVWCIYTTTTNAAGKLITTARTSSGASTVRWFSWGAPDQNDGDAGSFPGDNFNREHTWPQTYFNQDATPRGDRHHLYPTDAKLNGDHSNYPYGEVTSAVSAAPVGSNGSRVGTARGGLGYTGQVFEIADLYKGDIARAHFYMAVRYYNDAQFNKDAGFADTGARLKTWYDAMLRTWNALDPVSQKEIDRNNAIAASTQKNRNPFIDYPELVNLIDFVY